MRRAQGQFFDFAYTDLPAHAEFTTRIGPLRKSTFLREQCWGWAMEALGGEIKALAECPAFAVYQPPSESTKLGSLEPIKQSGALIKQVAPRWLELIEAVCCGSRLESPADIESIVPNGRHAIVLAILCHKLRPQRSTNLQTILGFYLLQGGARRRVLDTFCQFGLTISYTTLQRRMADLIGEAERKVKIMGQSPFGIVTYDNFDFLEGKRGERTGDTRIQRSITTSLIFKGRGLDAGALSLQPRCAMRHFRNLGIISLFDTLFKLLQISYSKYLVSEY